MLSMDFSDKSNAKLLELFYKRTDVSICYFFVSNLVNQSQASKTNYQTVEYLFLYITRFWYFRRYL